MKRLSAQEGKNLNIVETGSEYKPETRFIPASQWHKFHVWPTPGAMKYYIAQAREGQNEPFRKCLIKFGKRVLVDEARLLKLIKSKRMPAPPTGES